jgi:hypothetical protein
MTNNGLSIKLNKNIGQKIYDYLNKNMFFLMTIFLIGFSVVHFLFFYWNGLGLAYNDARSHLDIARRVVEGLKPGLAQIGSVWLPLPHLLMVPFIWNDFFWHTGLAGAVTSMIAYVITGMLMYKFMQELKVGLLGRLIGVLIFATNINVLYLQSTAMTELLLIATTLAAVYYLLLWSKKEEAINLIKAAFWTMMATLARYDGWFLLATMTGLIGLHFLVKRLINEKLETKNKIVNLLPVRYVVLFFKSVFKEYSKIEGTLVLFLTMGSLGVALWFLWNLLIFGDPLFFAFGPYSAHSQQLQLESAGDLITKYNLIQSIETYSYAMFFNLNAFTGFMGLFAGVFMMFDKRIPLSMRLVSLALVSPLLFNIIALFFGHSVLFVQGINGNTWFNVRYGIMMIASVGIYLGVLIDRVKPIRAPLIGLLIFVMLFSFLNFDAVTIDDARVGSSQKNVSEVSGYLKIHAKDQEGFILISAASHDAIIFSSTLPMKKFIHEGTGDYWKSATASPDRWARWIVMRTYDDNDSTWRLVKASDGLAKYELVAKYPFADVYQLKDEFLKELNTKPILPQQK